MSEGLRRRIRDLERGRRSRTPTVAIEWEAQLTEAEVDELILWHTRGCPEDELPEYFRPEQPPPGVRVLDWDDAKPPLEDAKAHATWFAKRPDLEHDPQAVDDFWKGEN